MWKCHLFAILFPFSAMRSSQCVYVCVCAYVYMCVVRMCMCGVCVCVCMCVCACVYVRCLSAPEQGATY